MKTLNLAASILMAALVLASCQQEERFSTVKVNLTDAPGDYEEVNIDLKQVQIQFADDTSGWQNLATEAGMYDLLQLQNGVDTLIGTGTFPEGTVHQLRLILGNDNNIVVDGETHPLTVPSGAESGLKVKVHKKLNQTLEELTVDFDAGLSVHQTGQGTYMLRPVLKMK
ncbi:MAG: DUF4382 domain-containing protein [Chitinophagaceae bacterium]